MIPQISAAELAAWRADAGRRPPALVDVREPWEVELCSITGSLSLPLGQFIARVDELPEDADLVLICHHGSRSQQAASWLARNGRPNVFNLAGGIEAWAAEVDPAMRRY